MFRMCVALWRVYYVSPGCAEPWKDLFQDFSLRTITISPSRPPPDPSPDTHGLHGVRAEGGRKSTLASAHKAAEEAKGDVTLLPGPYCFRVRARSSAGWGEWSNQVIVVKVTARLLSVRVLSVHVIRMCVLSA